MRSVVRFSDVRSKPLAQTAELFVWIAFPSATLSGGAALIGVPGGLLLAVFFGTAVSLMTFEGAFQKWREDNPAGTDNLDLDVRWGGFAYMRVPDKRVQGNPLQSIHILGDILIVNREKRRVILRLKAVMPFQTEPDYESDSWVYAHGVCIQEDVGVRVSTSAGFGTLPHLPTEIVLEPDGHARGHAEFVADWPFIEGHYGDDWEKLDSWLEIEDILSRRKRVFTMDTMVEV
jgi:hypothetical protein